MKVKFLEPIAGGINAQRGQELELDDKQAKNLIAAQICIQIDSFSKQETKGKRPRIQTR